MEAEAVTWAAIAVISTIGCLVASAVWCVATMSTSVKTLKDSILQLAKSVEKMDQRLDDHHIRIDRLETGRRTQ